MVQPTTDIIPCNNSFCHLTSAIAYERMQSDDAVIQGALIAAAQYHRGQYKKLRAEEAKQLSRAMVNYAKSKPCWDHK